MKCIVNNVKETEKLAKKFAKTLHAGTVIVLNGDLGAGKTTFTQKLFGALGVKEPVVSPTFTLLREYYVKNFDLYHFDMYRINDEDEALEFGLLEYFNNPKSICVIEWFDRVKNLLPKNYIQININKIDVSRREFEFLNIEG